MRAKLVRFSPGARTDWHSHALAQTLHIVSGIALNGTRDGTVFEVHPGERPWPHPPTSGGDGSTSSTHHGIYHAAGAHRRCV
ncbi:hypothetical protein [Streptomyces sp. NBC_01455]|uniref:hypothetical protein n=1 Tax=Streptomyces sp. NBC_01455 TaxID=2903874 RepID=UPI003FCD3113